MSLHSNGDSIPPDGQFALPDGKVANAWVITPGGGSGLVEGKANMASLLGELESVYGQASPQAGDFTGKADRTGSQQPEIYDPYAAFVAGHAVEMPPVHPEYWRQLYRRSSVQGACVRTKVSDIVGQGYTIRPRSELFPRLSDLKGNKAPDPAGQDTILDFLDLPQGHGETFSDILNALWQDAEVGGNGHIEIARNNHGNCVDFFSMNGESIRIARGGPAKGFWQIRGPQYAFFANYDGKKVAKWTQVTFKAGVDDGHPNWLYPDVGEFQPVVNADIANEIFQGKASGWSFDMGEQGVQFVGKSAETSSGLVPVDPGQWVKEKMRVNEVLHFKLRTPRDIWYGEPDIISGVEDYVVAQGVRLYSVAYFEHATVGRIFVMVEGDTQVTANLITTLEQFMSSQSRLDVMNQSVLVQVPADCKITIKDVKQAHMGEDEALSMLRERAEEYVRIANRVPRSAIPMVSGERQVNEDQNQRYLSSVVRPRQRYIMEKVNWFLGVETGVKDWVFDLNQPELDDKKTRYDLYEIGVRRGWLSINDVRRAENMLPIKGGDEPFVLVPGQGTVPISRMAEIADKLVHGAKVGDHMATGDTKTPPQGQLAVPLKGKAGPLAYMDPSGEKAFALVMNPNAIPDMPLVDREVMAMTLEKLVLNSDDVRTALGLPDEASAMVI
jgi:capsid portal protein